MRVDRYAPSLVAAGLLLVAAALKAHEIVTKPESAIQFGSRGWAFLLIEFEIFLACWLLSGAAPAACRRVALATFATFGSYAFYLGISGAASCGCFGRVTVNPWWTFGLDIVAILMLWRWKPGVDGPKSLHVVSVVVVPAVAGAILIAAIAMRPQTAIAEGIEVADSLVLLEPEKWAGKRFALAEYIDIGDELLSGNWTVLLYHHDCPDCRVALAELACQANNRESGQFAAIEVPPFGDATEGAGRAFAHGRLAGELNWFVQTPTVVTLIEGSVSAVGNGH